MGRIELARAIHNVTPYPLMKHRSLHYSKSRELVDIILNAVVKITKEKGKCVIPGFGRFYIKRIKGYKTICNNQKRVPGGYPRWVPPRSYFAFKPCKSFKGAMRLPWDYDWGLEGKPHLNGKPRIYNRDIVIREEDM